MLIIIYGYNLLNNKIAQLFLTLDPKIKLKHITHFRVYIHLNIS